MSDAANVPQGRPAVGARRRELTAPAAYSIFRELGTIPEEERVLRLRFATLRTNGDRKVT